MKKIIIFFLCIVISFACSKDSDKDTDNDKELTPAEQQMNLIVDELSKNNDLALFASQLRSIDISDMDAESFTVFAVLNSESGNITSGIVKRHVVKGLRTREQLINGLTFTTIDNTTLIVDVVGKTVYVNSVPIGNEIKAGNSIIYVLPRIMPVKNTKTLEQQKLVISELRKNENLSVFADQVELLDLSEIDTDAFTVFAVADIPEAESSGVKSGTSPTPDEIKRHIVTGAWAPEKLTDGTVLISINGTELKVRVHDGVKYINGRALGEIITTKGNIITVVSSLLPPETPHKYIIGFEIGKPYPYGGGELISENGVHGYQSHLINIPLELYYFLTNTETIVKTDSVAKFETNHTLLRWPENRVFEGTYNPEFSLVEETAPAGVWIQGGGISMFVSRHCQSFHFTFNQLSETTQWGWHELKGQYVEKTHERVIDETTVECRYIAFLSAKHTNGVGYLIGIEFYIHSPKP